MTQKDKQENRTGTKKIKLGRLSIDPVFLLLFIFFTASALLLQLYIWLALR